MSIDGRFGVPAVAAVTLHERGGGIAALSRLLVDALTAGNGQRVRTLTLIDRPRPGGAFPTSTLDRLRFGVRVAACQVQGLCDWMFFTHLSLATVEQRMPSWARRPYAVFLHDVEAWVEQPRRRAAVLQAAFLRVANSEYTARRVMDANPGVGPVVGCPLALAPDWTALALEAMPPPAATSPTILIVGRMVASERYKGHDQLIGAWPQVAARRPDARLICVGEGDDVPRLREKAAALGVAGQVQFPGFVSEAERLALYRRAQIFAMPSRREGFGLVYLEAMATGLPCIGSIHDAAPGIIVDGETGFLIDQDDMPALADRILLLLDRPDARRAMGDAGRRRFLASFTADAFARRIAAHLASTLPSPLPRSLADVRPSGS
jgi:phosphatidylinositol alpha-1,6-mannosyltransferase